MKKFALAMMIIMTGAVRAEGQTSRPPLDVDDVVTLLEMKEVSSADRIAVVKRRCVSFRPNDTELNRLKAAGADEAFLGALLTACYAAAKSEAKSSEVAVVETPEAPTEPPAKFVYGAKTNNENLILAITETIEHTTIDGTPIRIQSGTSVHNIWTPKSPVTTGYVAAFDEKTSKLQSFKGRAVQENRVIQSLDLKQSNGNLTGSFQAPKSGGPIAPGTLSSQLMVQDEFGRIGIFPLAIKGVGTTLNWATLYWRGANGYADRPSPMMWAGRVVKETPVTVAAGSFDTYEVELLLMGRLKAGKFWVTRAEPHVVVKLDTGMATLELACVSAPGISSLEGARGGTTRDPFAEQLMAAGAGASTSGAAQSEADRKIEEALAKHLPARQQPSLSAKDEKLLEAMSIAGSLFSGGGKKVNSAESACEGL